MPPVALTSSRGRPCDGAAVVGIGDIPFGGPGIRW
jgi:hypothetical protein